MDIWIVPVFFGTRMIRVIQPFDPGTLSSLPLRQHCVLIGFNRFQWVFVFVSNKLVLLPKIIQLQNISQTRPQSLPNMSPKPSSNLRKLSPKTSHLYPKHIKQTDVFSLGELQSTPPPRVREDLERSWRLIRRFLRMSCTSALMVLSDVDKNKHLPNMPRHLRVDLSLFNRSSTVNESIRNTFDKQYALCAIL